MEEDNYWRWFFVPGDVRWKKDLARKASEAFFQRQRAIPNLASYVYDNTNGNLLSEFLQLICFCSDVLYFIFK